MSAAAGRRGLAGSVGRAALFGVLSVAMSFAAYGLLASPLGWVVARTGVHVRMDELLLLAGTLAATALMLRAVDVRPWRDVGLGRDALRMPQLAWGTTLGGAAIGAACAALFLAGWLRLEPALPGSSLAAAVSVTAFLAPAALYEELLCRGYLLTALRDSVGARWAAVATSVLFGVLHLQNVGASVQSVGIVTLAGLFLAAVRLAYDSLYAAWAAHLAWNWLLAVPLHAVVSGQRFASPDYRTVEAGPDWITGGAWGPEGGLAAAVGMVAALACLWHRRDRVADGHKPEESRHDG